MELPPLDEIRKLVQVYLKSYRLKEGAAAWEACAAEVTPGVEDEGCEVVLRCGNPTYDALKCWNDATREHQELMPMKQIERGLKAVLGRVRSVQVLWRDDGKPKLKIRVRRKQRAKGKRGSSGARAREDGGAKREEGESQKPGANSEAGIVKANGSAGEDGPCRADLRRSVDGERVGIGRLAYTPGFLKVWVDGELFELSPRPKARACLRRMVERESFEEQSALHFLTEIDPEVRRQCQLPDLPAGADTRIHHYFNPKKSPYDRLRRLLIVCSGRCGRYYLKVR